MARHDDHKDEDDSDLTPLISSGEIIVGRHLALTSTGQTSISKTGNSLSKNFNSIITAAKASSSRSYKQHHRSCLQESGSKYVTIPETLDSWHEEEDITVVVESKSIGRSNSYSKTVDESSRLLPSNDHRRTFSISNNNPHVTKESPGRIRLPSILLNTDKIYSKKRSPVHEHGCLLQFVLQGIVILEVVSLIFFVTILLYTQTYPTNYDRNKNAIGLFVYVLFMMVYGIFSLQISFGIGIKVVTALLKSFAASVFFSLSLQHIILLPVFFFYFFPAVIATCVNFVLTWSTVTNKTQNWRLERLQQQT